jgi:flagellar hook-basal body complex protein FliE
MRRIRPRTLTAAWLLTALLSSACGDPPNKEMDQAQGAIDAARAAGADRFAATEFEAANAALREAHEAVTQRDYRQALNQALESRERAQNAAREAADTRARLRGEAEKAMADVSISLAQAQARLAAPGARSLPAARLREARKVLASATTALQEVGAAIQKDDFGRTTSTLAALKSQIDAQIASLDPRRSAAPARRRR